MNDTEHIDVRVLFHVLQETVHSDEGPSTANTGTETREVEITTKLHVVLCEMGKQSISYDLKSIAFAYQLSF